MYIKTKSLILLLLLICISCQPQGTTAVGRATPNLPINSLEPDLPARPTRVTYYVSKNGGDKRSGKTEAEAFRTIAHAISKARAGDVVVIKEGNYQESDLRFTHSGKKDAPITFMAAPDEKVVIDWSRLEGGKDSQRIWINANHIVLRDIEVYASPQQCIFLYDGASYNYFINMTLNSCWGSGLQIYEGSFNVVAYSVAKDNYGGGDSDGFGSIGQGGNSEANAFWYNVASRNSDDGFDTWRGKRTLQYVNISHGNGYNGGDGNGFKLGSNGYHVNNTVRRNIAYQNKLSGFDTNLGGGNIIENNTAWQNRRHNFESSRASSKNIWRNNLSLDGSVGMFDDKIEEHNSWNKGINSTDVLSLDPNSSMFLSLTSSSSAIDKGVDVGLPFEGSAPDLGALEHGMQVTEF